MRDEIKAAFENGQLDLGDVEEQSDRLLRDAKRIPASRARQLWPSLAGVAVVLIAAAAVATSVVVRGSHPRPATSNHPSPAVTTTPTAQPTATAAPTPLAQPLQVAATVPVILFHDPADFDQIDGITWDGLPKGRVGVNPVSGQGIYPNPAGTLFATTRDIRDRSDAAVATLPSPSKGFPGTWADDGTHYCAMASKSPLGQAGGEPATLRLAAIGQPPRDILQVGTAYEQASIGVGACSIERDTAIIVQSGGQGVGTAQFWVVQLSTGRILWSKSYPQDGLTTFDIRASRDGQYIAEVTYRNGTNTTIVYTNTGSVLTHVAGRIEAFSWDGTLAVQMPDYRGPVSAIRWRDGTVVWTGPAGEGYEDALPEPGGQRLAFELRDPAIPQTGGYPAVNVYVVSPDGTSTELLKDVM